jgi:hypothetical protein
VSPRLRFPPPGSGQLRGRCVSSRLQFPPSGSGQLWGRVSPQLRFPPPGSGQLRGWHCVPWAPAPASWHRAASGVPRVPAAPGWMNTVESSSSENIAPDEFFFSTRLLTQGSSGGSAYPRGSGPDENSRANVEDLAEPGRCKPTPIRSKWNRVQGRLPTATESIPIHEGDSNLICGGLAIAGR